MGRNKSQEAFVQQRSTGIMQSLPQSAFDSAAKARLDALEISIASIQSALVTIAFLDVITYTDQTSTLFDSITNENARVKIAEQVFAMRSPV